MAARPSATPDVEDRRQAAKAKRQAIVQEDEEAHIVYVRGVNVDLTKINPLTLEESIKSTVGGVEKIFSAGNSLKVYCISAWQKTLVLSTTTLADKNVICTEKVVGFKSSSRKQIKEQERCVITGVPLEMSCEVIKEKTQSLQAVRLNKFEKGVRSPSLSVLLMYKRGEVPAVTKIGYTNYRTRAYIPTPTRCQKCQGFNHVAKNCHRTETCSRCAGSHSFKDCTKKEEPHCANCNGNHSAAYKGCKEYKEVSQATRLQESTGMNWAAAVRRVKADIKQSTTTSAPSAPHLKVTLNAKSLTSGCMVRTPAPETTRKGRVISVALATQTDDAIFNGDVTGLKLIVPTKFKTTGVDVANNTEESTLSKPGTSAPDITKKRQAEKQDISEEEKTEDAETPEDSSDDDITEEEIEALNFDTRKVRKAAKKTITSKPESATLSNEEMEKAIKNEERSMYKRFALERRTKKTGQKQLDTEKKPQRSAR